MRLPTDVLLSILDALPRDSLDTVAIGNRLLSELCTTNFREYPLRLTDLTVDCRSRAGTASVVTDKYKAADGKHLHANLDSLGRYLSQATLRYLSILGAFDERILELLLPFRDRFRTAALMHNYPYECSRRSFASPDVFIRAYNELFFCCNLQICPVSISGSPPDVNGANARLLTLPCIQQCSDLFFKNMPFANAGDITTWLTSGGEKSLIMHGTPHEEREAFAHILIDKVVQQFRSASSASNFSVVYETIRAPSLKATVHENTLTSEKLVVTIERYYLGGIRMSIRRSKL